LKRQKRATTYDAPAGTLVMIPPGAAHMFGNPGERPPSSEHVHPDLYVQYFRDLGDMIAGGQPPTPEAILEVMARCATEPVGASDA
jgi:hypothetical protein